MDQFMGIVAIVFLIIYVIKIFYLGEKYKKSKLTEIEIKERLRAIEFDIASLWIINLANIIITFAR